MIAMTRFVSAFIETDLSPGRCRIDCYDYLIRGKFLFF
jgi:hypothetical protein